MFKSLRTWPVVALTFMVVMIVAAVVTVLTFTSIRSLRSSVIGQSDAHRIRHDHIEALRSRIYVSSILVRDALLDRDSARVATHNRRLRENHAEALRHLEELQRQTSRETRAAVLSLAVEVNAYWRSIDQFLKDTGSNRILNGYSYLRTQLLPRQRAVISLAEELADLSAAEARSGRAALNISIDEFQQYILWLRSVTTLFVAALALFTTVRIFRLERASALEQRKVASAEAELRHLSQQLVSSQEQERRSLSRELHDHVGQMMTALRFGLSELEQHCPKPTRHFSDALQNCRIMLEQTIEAIRGLAMGLRPSMLDDLGLGAAIEWQAREFSRQFDVPVTVIVDPRVADWPEPQRTALYRVTQEALTNCARHARASRVRIELIRESDSVTLTVADDGVGVSDSQRHRGFGLIGMEERVREIGGRLDLHSGFGRGTTVEVSIPVAGDAARA